MKLKTTAVENGFIRISAIDIAEKRMLESMSGSDYFGAIVYTLADGSTRQIKIDEEKEADAILDHIQKCIEEVEGYSTLEAS